MIDLTQIEQRIKRGEEIEKIIEKIDWKEFEEFVLRILEEHDFKSFHNFRFKTETLHEIDILATKENLALAVDCKQWDKGRYKKSGLKNAVLTQKERVQELGKMLEKNILTKDFLNLSGSPKLVPLIVTWFEEDLIEHEDVFVVPVWKFNQFLLNLNQYI
jgi:Holliday junction resolvase-like predicted endonuclease